MKRPTFLHGVVAAAALAFFASAILATLTPFLGLGGAIRLAVPVLALSYLAYLMGSISQSTRRQPTGRLVTLSLWCALAAVTWWTAPPLPIYLLIHAGAVWLVRSLYVYSGVIPAAMDLGLCVLSLLTFSWAFMRTGSIFAATWSYFLVQALWVAVPPRIQGRYAMREPTSGSEPFEHARRQADEALRQLSSR
jgi:hypothetical protein